LHGPKTLLRNEGHFSFSKTKSGETQNNTGEHGHGSQNQKSGKTKNDQILVE